jgi:hypothetical protein
MLLLRMTNSSLTLFIVQWQNKFSFELVYVLWILLDIILVSSSHMHFCFCVSSYMLVVTFCG